MRRDEEIIYDGEKYRVVYFQNFVAKPFGIVSKLTGHRVYSFETEQAAIASVLERDKAGQYAER